MEHWSYIVEYQKWFKVYSNLALSYINIFNGWIKIIIFIAQWLVEIVQWFYQLLSFWLQCIINTKCICVSKKTPTSALHSQRKLLIYSSKLRVLAVFLLEMRLLFLSACFDITSKWIMVKNIKMYTDTLLRVLL